MPKIISTIPVMKQKLCEASREHFPRLTKGLEDKIDNLKAEIMLSGGPTIRQYMKLMEMEDAGQRNIQKRILLIFLNNGCHSLRKSFLNVLFSEYSPLTNVEFLRMILKLPGGNNTVHLFVDFARSVYVREKEIFGSSSFLPEIVIENLNDLLTIHAREQENRIQLFGYDSPQFDAYMQWYSLGGTYNDLLELKNSLEKDGINLNLEGIQNPLKNEDIVNIVTQLQLEPSQLWGPDWKNSENGNFWIKQNQGSDFMSNFKDYLFRIFNR